jgi:hypothetical protein
MDQLELEEQKREEEEKRGAENSSDRSLRLE